MACKSIFWVNMNSDIDETVRNFHTCLISSQHELRIKSGEADIFTINNNHLSSSVDYHSKFPIIKHIDGHIAANLIKMQDLGYRLRRKVVLYVDT